MGIIPFIEIGSMYVLWVSFILLILFIYSKLYPYIWFFPYYIQYKLIIHSAIFMSLFSMIYRIFLYWLPSWMDKYLQSYIDSLKILISNNEDFVLLITCIISINFLILFINLLLICIYKEGSWLRRLLFGKNEEKK